MSGELPNTPGGDWQELARAAAQPEVTGAGSVARLELLRCDAAGTPYALSVRAVREIVRLRTITPLPRVPQEVRGVISLRGEILQVIDLRQRLGLPRGPDTKASRIVVVRDEEGRQAGVSVDAVHEVIRVPRAELRPALAGDGGELVESLCPYGEGYVSVLDLPRVLEPRHV